MSLTSGEDELLARELVRLVDQSLWANHRWTDFVFAQSETDSRPRELLGHLMISEKVWIERIAGVRKARAPFPVLGREELLAGFDDSGRTLRRLIAERPNEIIEFKRASGEEYHARVIDIVHQILTHGYHHRGQLASHYARAGVASPNTDHINYLIENRL